MGGQYEVKDGATKKYYSIAGMTVAMQDASGLQYLLTDHLGSTVAVTNSSGTLTSQQRYLPFGGVRSIPNSPILSTDFGYTGQRLLDAGMGGIMDYKARFYSPALGRFVQPDTIIPDQFNPQSWNRFSYVINNPTNHIDPTGHQFVSPSVIVPVILIGVLALGIIAYNNQLKFLDFPGNKNLRSKDLLHFPQGPGPGGQWDPNKKSLGEKLVDEARLVRDLCKVNKKTCAVGILAGLAIIFTVTLDTINPQPNNLRCALNSNDPECRGNYDDSDTTPVTATATATPPATAATATCPPPRIQCSPTTSTPTQTSTSTSTPAPLSPVIEPAPIYQRWHIPE